jgi:hypothetical protein
MSASGVRPAWQLPVQWPRPAEQGFADRDVAARERLVKAGIVLCLLGFTVFQRFGLRLSDTYAIQPSLLAMYALVAAMVFAGVAELNVRAALAYLAVVTVAASSFIVNATFGRAQYVSLGSLLLLIVFYAPFSVSLARGAARPHLWRWMLEAYIGFAVFLALAGTLQFFAQFVFRPPWLFDYTPLIPAPIRGEGIWNTVNPAGEWIKTNGFFLREASGMSFTMALGLLSELSLRRRKWVIAVLAMALVLTYSGSGILALAVALLFPLGGRSVLQLVAAAAAAAVLFFLLGDSLNLSYTVERIGEINSEKSSAYCRFVLPGIVAFQEIDSAPWTSLLGHGPGTMQKMHNTCETTFGKAIFEYGLLGAAAFCALIAWTVNRSAAPIRIRVALALYWVLLGGFLLGPDALLLIYVISAMWPQGIASSALPRQPGR